MGEGNGIHSSTFAWKFPWTEEPGRLQAMRSLESDTTERLHFHFPLSCIGEGNGNPLQCSCLENPRDGEAWWTAVHGVAQSRTRLKGLSSSSSGWIIHIHTKAKQYIYIYIVLHIICAIYMKSHKDNKLLDFIYINTKFELLGMEFIRSFYSVKLKKKKTKKG